MKSALFAKTSAQPYKKDPGSHKGFFSVRKIAYALLMAHVFILSGVKLKDIEKRPDAEFRQAFGFLRTYSLQL